jgi:hypothetical protein
MVAGIGRRRVGDGGRQFAHVASRPSPASAGEEDNTAFAGAYGQGPSPGFAGRGSSVHDNAAPDALIVSKGWVPRITAVS